MTDTQELLPCPFCGDNGDVWQRKDNEYGVGCGGNTNSCPFDIVAWFPTKEEAIAVWNTRAPVSRPSAAGDVVESGERALRFLEMKGYRRCDIAACNCPYWHGGNADELLKELHELMSENGYSPDAKTLYKAVEELIVKEQAHPVTPLNVDELVEQMERIRPINPQDSPKEAEAIDIAVNQAIALIRKWANKEGL